MKRYLIFLILLVFFSCEKEVEYKSIMLPYTPILSSGSSWGVVVSNYVRIKEEPLSSSTMLKSLTKGSLVEVLFLSRNLEQEKTVSWYHISLNGMKGWILEEELEIFKSREEAASFAEDIK
jgi:hypothetical protein